MLFLTALFSRLELSADNQAGCEGVLGVPKDAKFLFKPCSRLAGVHFISD